VSSSPAESKVEISISDNFKVQNLKDPAYFLHFLALRHNESRGPNEGRQAGNSLLRMKIIVIASDTLRGWTPECDGGAVFFNFLEMK
jgi:hypothetical protein